MTFELTLPIVMAIINTALALLALRRAMTREQSEETKALRQEVATLQRQVAAMDAILELVREQLPSLLRGIGGRR